MTRYTEVSSFSRGISGTIFFFFLKITVFTPIFSRLSLTKLMCLLTIVHIRDYLTWISGGPESMQSYFLCFGEAPCSCTLQHRPTSLTSARSFMTHHNKQYVEWLKRLRCLCRGRSQPCKLGLLTLTFIHVVRSQIFNSVIC